MKMNRILNIKHLFNIFNQMDFKSETKRLILENNKNKDKPLHHRLILKDGNCNINHCNTRREKLSALLKYMNLVSASWLTTIIFFTVLLLFSFIFFGVLYYLICYAHGDFEEAHLPHNQPKNGFKPCIYHINNFASCLLFSFETQHTVGYGIKATTEECPEAIFVNTVQCIFGFILQGSMAVIIFTKMTLPKLRSTTLFFSKKAVICKRNNCLCLMFRVGDMRKNHISDARVRAFFVRSIKTIEGEVLNNQQIELNLKNDGCKTNIFFNWPLIMLHEITKNSPLYYFSPADFQNERFEIVVVLEGTILSTGQNVQAKSSYVGDEIVWGYIFSNLLEFNHERGEFEVDFSKFDELLPIKTPLCSAAYMNDYNQLQQVSRSGRNLPFTIPFTPRNSIGCIDLDKKEKNVLLNVEKVVNKMNFIQ